MVSGERLLLIAAEPREFAGLVRFCRDIEPLKWPVHWARSARLNGREALLLANGAGAARAAQAVEVARATERVNAVCSIGFCGALDEDMKVGDIFVAERVLGSGHDYVSGMPESRLPHRTGALASIDHVAGTAREKSDLRAGGALAVEMEAAGVAAKAEELGIPFYCMRSVTDLAHEGFGLDFNAALRADGRFDTMRLIAAACRRPLYLLPELLRLGWRCRTAARTLGEFVADCRF